MGGRAAREADAGPQGFNLKFEETPIEMVMQDYGDTLGRTLLLSPGLPKANITLRSHEPLEKQEYLEAIEAVLGMHGIALLREGDNFLRVVQNKTARTEPMSIRETLAEGGLPETNEMISQMIQLRHIEIEEASKIVEPIKHPYGTVQLFERTNSLLLTDTAATVNRIAQIIKFVDQPVETRDETNIIQIQFAKAADVKRRLEEMIEEVQKDQQKKAAIPRSRDSGQPGVIRPTTVTSTVGGVIRPTPAASSAAGAGSMDSDLIELAERGIVRGSVKMVADDRTNILIIITRPENMKFFNRIVEVLDVPTAPDVVVKVFRMEFAVAKDVASMLNDLIGATTTASKEDIKGSAGAERGSKGKAASGTAATQPAPESPASTALRDYTARLQQTTAEGGPSRIGQLSKDNVKIMADERTNALIIMASKGDLASLEAIVKDMDIRLSQVLIETVIMEIELDDDISSGVDWVQRSMIGYSGEGDSREAKIAYAGGGGGGKDDPKNATSFTSTDSLSGVGSGLSYYMTFFDLNLDAVVKFAASDSRSRVVSTPVILTTDNTEAKLQSTDKIYVLDTVTYRSTTDGGDYNNYSKEDVGLVLTVTPHINTNRVVSLDIAQEISEPNANPVTDVNQLTGSTIFKERKLEAFVAVQSGQTIVLGGAVREQKDTASSKIPFLGDIPILGRLFSYRSNSKKRTETVIFLTPFVMDSPEEIAAESKRRKNSLNDNGMWRRGWSGSPLADPSRDTLLEDRALQDMPSPVSPVNSEPH
jgi:general secretion pathway protein D